MDGDFRFTGRVISGASLRGLGGASAWQFVPLDAGQQHRFDESNEASQAPALSRADVEAAHTRGFTEGLKAGFANAQQHYEAELAKKQDALRGPVRAFCAQFAALDDSVAEALLRMALDLARNVVRAELTTPVAVTRAVLLEGLTHVGEAARGARVVLNPEDCARLKADCPSELAEYSLTFCADARMASGGCIIEAGNTQIDATLDKRWQQAVARIGRSDEFAQPNENSI